MSLFIANFHHLVHCAGDSHQGRGVAALNLLSDLKDQCGWKVEQPKQNKGLTSVEPQVPPTPHLCPHASITFLLPGYEMVECTVLDFSGVQLRTFLPREHCHTGTVLMRECCKLPLQMK
jgi:hypothetical protein